VDEMMNLLKSIPGFKYTKAKAIKMISEFDRDNNAKINMSEFKELMRRRKDSEEG